MNDKLNRNSRIIKETTQRLRVLSIAISEIKENMQKTDLTLEDIATLIGVKFSQVRAFANNYKSSLVPKKIPELYNLLVNHENKDLKQLINESAKSWFERLNYLFNLNPKQIEIFCGIRDYFIQKVSAHMEWKAFVKNIPDYVKFISLTKKGGKSFDLIVKNEELWNEWALFLESKKKNNSSPEVESSNKIIISLTKPTSREKGNLKVIKNKAAPVVVDVVESTKVSDEDFDTKGISPFDDSESADDFIIKALMKSSQRTRALTALIISSKKSSSQIAIPKELSDELDLLYINLQALAKEYPSLPYNQIVKLYNALKKEIGAVVKK